MSYYAQCERIAEGDERDTDRESVRFFYVAKGSLAELRTQLQIAHEIGYLDDNTYNNLNEASNTVANMLGKLIKARSAPKPTSPTP